MCPDDQGRDAHDHEDQSHGRGPVHGPGERALRQRQLFGAPINTGNLRRRVLKPAAEEACVSWVGFHTFRHTCAFLLFAEGRNAVQVKRWLGHH